MQARLAAAIAVVPDEALPYIADGLLVGLHLAVKRDRDRLNTETIESLRTVGRIADEVFGGPKEGEVA